MKIKISLFVCITGFFVFTTISCGNEESANKMDSSLENTTFENSANAHEFSDVIDLSNKKELNVDEALRLMNYMNEKEIILVAYPVNGSYSSNLKDGVIVTSMRGNMSADVDYLGYKPKITLRLKSVGDTLIIPEGELVAVKRRVRVTYLGGASGYEASILLSDVEAVEYNESEVQKPASITDLNFEKPVLWKDLKIVLEKQFKSNLANNPIQITGNVASFSGKNIYLGEGAMTSITCKLKNALSQDEMNDIKNKTITIEGNFGPSSIDKASIVKQ